MNYSQKRLCRLERNLLTDKQKCMWLMPDRGKVTADSLVFVVGVGTKKERALYMKNSSKAIK